MAIENEKWFKVGGGIISEVLADNVPDKYKTKNMPKFKSEGTMTEFLAKYPDVIMEELLVTHGDPEGHGGADITGISKEGQLVVGELKKSTINASTLGQAFGYGIEVDRWPRKSHLLSKMKYWEISGNDDFINRIENGSKKNEFPLIAIIGNNVAGSLLEMMRFIQERCSPQRKIEILPLSIGFFAEEDDSTGYVCRRFHKPEPAPFVKWDEWEPGDLSQNIEWLDTDWFEGPVMIMGKTDDGQTIVKKTTLNKDGKYKPVGESRIVPFLSNHKRL